jgi:NADH-quinone oxidoreductase subunit J
MLASTTHYADWGVFSVAAVIVVAGALGVVTARHPVHCALFLIQTLFGVAVLFVSELAHFLAAVQVIVYAGAIVVLILFVIMLLGVDKADHVAAEPLRAQIPMAILLGIIGLAEFAGLVRAGDWSTGAVSLGGAASAAGSNVELLGRSLFTTYLLAFEVTSVLLVIAVVAAVALTRRPPTLTPEEAADEQAAEDPAAEDPAAEVREGAST